MKRGDLVYLQHVLDAIAKIELYLDDIDQESFVAQSLIQDGVIRQLEIIGEAIKQVSASIRESHPEIPWKDFAGMRDKLIHQYFGVDLEQVWLTVSGELTQLKRQISEICTE